jgi:hypothetical protein
MKKEITKLELGAIAGLSSLLWICSRTSIGTSAWLMADRSQYCTGRQEFAAANRTAADSGFGSFSAGGRFQVEKPSRG